MAPEGRTVSPSDDGGYVHDPSRFDEDGERIEGGGPIDGVEESVGASESDVDGDGADWLEDPTHPAEADRTFDWRGWLLVGVIVIAFVIAPLGILLYPPDAGSYLFALILIPLIPALLLAITAVWVTTRP